MSSFISNAFMLPNDLIDKGYMAQMKGAALPCYLFIVRKTRGWNKVSDTISLSQLIEGTGYKKDAVLTGLEQLISMQIIKRVSYANRPAKYTLTEKAVVGKTDSKDESTVGKTDSRVGKTDSTQSEKPTHNNNRKTTKEKTNEVFEFFWSEYPKCKRKGSKADALKTFSKYENQGELITRVLQLFKQDESFLKQDGEFIPSPSSWLNKKHWENDYWVEKLNQCKSSANHPAPPQQYRGVTKKFKGM